MEQPQPIGIRYTAKLFPPVPSNTGQTGSFPIPLLTYSQDNVPLDSLLQDKSSNHDVQPVLEIVTSFHNVEAKAVDVTERPMKVLRSAISTCHRSTLMMVHSVVLSQVIRDLVEHYPR